MEKKTRILIVDDEPSVRESLGSWFREEGYAADIAGSGKEALQKIAEEGWDIFLIDIKMPGMDGLELERRILELCPGTTIIIMTAYASIETAVTAMKQGAYDYIVKPFDPEALELLVRNASERKRLISENRLLRQRIDEESGSLEIVGVSPAAEKIRELVKAVAGTDVPVLICGERGTGKELAARAIHSMSPRRYMPFSIANCGGMAGELLESELFGHEMGTLAEARYRKKGKMEMADGGTLFLDEIGALDAKIQVGLLRALEDKRIVTLGGSAPVAVDFRLIAATTMDIEAMVSKGAFREDLFLRLNVAAISIPPLRERREDIPLLAEHFARLYSKSMNRPFSGFAPEALEVLVRQDWRGNARELENAVERAVLVSRSGKIFPSDLLLPGEGIRPSPEREGAGGSRTGEPDRGAVENAIQESRGDLALAARLLGIDRVALCEKLRKLGIRLD